MLIKSYNFIFCPFFAPQKNIKMLWYNLFSGICYGYRIIFYTAYLQFSV
nr:MAG TPA: hypothetical protein [Caudoviricetes sp.]